MNTTMSSA